MPTKICRVRGTKAPAFVHTCEVCFSMATFGFGVKFKEALKALDRKDMDLAIKLLGIWFCKNHKPVDIARQDAV